MKLGIFNPTCSIMKKTKKGWINITNKVFGIISIILFFSYSVNAGIVEAIHKVETGGRQGAIIGDNGKALGPLQIHKECFIDSKVIGKYSDCADYNFSCKVFLAYCKKYEPKALANNDFEILARLWNGGCGWRKNKQATNNYWSKVKINLTK